MRGCILSRLAYARVTISLPWWWKIYALACCLRCRIMGTEPDTDAIAEKITRHVRCDVKMVSE